MARLDSARIAGVLCAASITMFAADSAQAITPEMPFEITPFVGGRVGGSFDDDASNSEVELENSPSIGLILNIREDVNTQWEVAYAFQPTEIDIDSLSTSLPPSLSGAQGSDLDIHHLQFGGTYITDGTWARPYMAATVGLAHIDPEFAAFDSDTYFAFTIGGGVKIYPTRRLGLQLEGRMYGTVVDSKSNIFCVSGVGGANCLFEVQGDVIWQFELSLGATYRF